ncbi:plasmid replication protein RepC [uncultured Tateyamaria sp.]|uniref:plasmid replication protein RepC n=1 Tax=uncultured Tateyamaria sp. TaxID=455651 RepID=UPI0026398089|nr:plasmid replication protein RepC [uncultured Tateyamaria sp.]
MTIHAQTSFGQAGTRASSGPATVDKWHLLDALTHAAPEFRIGHRQIGVLRALISFHQQRFWPITADTLIVYPSNRTLCERLGGMPDSTLRRHLNTLISAGLLARRASSNGKRFRRGRGANEVAYGLDLGPLIARTAAIYSAAKSRQDAAETLAAERTRLLSLREDLRQTDDATHATFLADLARAIRRKLSLIDLREWIAALHTRLSAVRGSKKMSASDSQNERHIETQERNIKGEAEHPNDLTAQELDTLCNERSTLFPDALRSWSDVTRSASIIAPMMGIGSNDMNAAYERQGPLGTSIAILYVLEVLSKVDAPAPYFRQLTKAPNMLLSVIEMLRSRQLSADKSKVCLITAA